MNTIIKLSVVGWLLSTNFCCARLSSTHLWKYLATKTPYDKRPSVAFPGIPWSSKFYEFTKDHIVLYVDGMIRHGTRFPSEKKLLKWEKHIQKLMLHDGQALLKKSIELWKDHFPNGSDYTLHSRGWGEMTNLAEAFYNMTRDLLICISVRGSQITVLSSPKIRVKSSACAFLKRLSFLVTKEKRAGNVTHCCSFHHDPTFVDSDSYNCSETPIFINTHLLRQFDHCDKYILSVENNETAAVHVHNFSKSDNARTVINDMSKHFGRTLTWDEVTSLYQLCSFQYGLYDYDSICSLFEENHLQVMEYACDLNHYYKTGYGYDINYQLACHLLQDMIDKLDKAVDNYGSQNLSQCPNVFLLHDSEPSGCCPDLATTTDKTASLHKHAFFCFTQTLQSDDEQVSNMHPLAFNFISLSVRYFLKLTNIISLATAAWIF